MNSVPIRCGCHVHNKNGDHSRYKDPVKFGDALPMGCGAVLIAEELFRCLDCGMAFCKACLQSHCKHDLQVAQDGLKVSEAKRELMKTALEWYAVKRRYWGINDAESEMFEDRGERARQALE